MGRMSHPTNLTAGSLRDRRHRMIMLPVDRIGPRRNQNAVAQEQLGPKRLVFVETKRLFEAADLESALTTDQDPTRTWDVPLLVEQNAPGKFRRAPHRSCC